MKKILCFFVFLLLFFVGCGEDKAKVGLKDINKDAVYKSENICISLPEKYRDCQIDAYSVSDNYIYFVCHYSESGKDSEHETFLLGRSTKDGNDSTILHYEGDGETGNTYVIDQAIGCDKDNVAIRYYKYSTQPEDSEDYIEVDSKEYIAVFDALGNKLYETETKEYYEDIFFLKDRLIFIDSHKIISADIKSDASTEVSAVNYECIFEGGSENLIATSSAEGKMLYTYIDPVTLKETERFESEDIYDPGYMVFKGNKENDLITIDEKSINGFDPKTGNILQLCDIEYSGVYWGGSVTDIKQEDDGNFYVSVEAYSSNHEMSSKLIKCVKIPPDKVKEKEIVSIGCLGIAYSDVDELIANLNSRSDKYFYTLKEYKESDNPDDISNISEFDKDITSKHIPDIVMCGRYGIGADYNLNKYISRGLFLPLNDYLENDPEIDADDIFPSLKEACSYEGNIYTVIPSFVVKTMICKEKICGDKENISFSDFMDILNEYPNSSAFYNATREEIYSNFLSMEENPFFSVTAQRNNFDSDEFIEFLKFIKDIPNDYIIDPNEFDYEEQLTNAYDKDESLFIMCEIGAADSLAYYEKLFLKDDSKAVGYPNNRGYKGYIRSNQYTIGISAKTKNKDAAWEFVRYFLTEEYQDSITAFVPASMKSFDKQAKRLMNTDHYDWFYMYDTVTVEPIDQNDVDKVRDVILSSGGNSYYDENIIRIIEEEAEPYFTGEKTAEEAAKMIQSRVSIYLKE